MSLVSPCVPCESLVSPCASLLHIFIITSTTAINNLTIFAISIIPAAMVSFQCIIVVVACIFQIE